MCGYYEDDSYNINLCDICSHREKMHPKYKEPFCDNCFRNLEITDQFHNPDYNYYDYGHKTCQMCLYTLDFDICKKCQRRINLKDYYKPMI